MAKEPWVVAVDLGATNVRLALVNARGYLVSRWELATATMPDQDSLVNTLAAELANSGQEARSRHCEVKAVGIGGPGRVLVQEGRVALSPNLPALNDCPLAPRLQALLEWTVFLEKDAHLLSPWVERQA